MSGITIPTLDEITGHTVMAKLRSLCKRFIGLAEEVDEKIDAPLEEAHQAVQTANTASANAQQSVANANQAVQTANTASANANSASESAQESAETVAGYDTRLTAVENGKINITDINNYAIGLTGNQNCTGNKGFSAIKTPYIEVQTNFRPVIYYGGYDATDVQTAQRIRPITVFTSPNSIERPILRLETIDDTSVTGVELTTTVYNSGINRGISIYTRKSDGMAYVTAPSRGSTNISDYPSNEVVTIDTLRKLGLIQ